MLINECELKIKIHKRINSDVCRGDWQTMKCGLLKVSSSFSGILSTFIHFFIFIYFFDQVGPSACSSYCFVVQAV